MARNLPARTSKNGLKTVETVRDDRGRFVAGAPPGPGRPANGFARYRAALHTAVLAEVDAADVRGLVRTLVRLGTRGNLAAVKLFFEHVLGPLPMPIDPDELDRHELDVKRRRPTLIDALALGELPAADPDEPPADEEAEEADPLAPSLRQTLAWAVEELAQAQYALRTQRPPPPDPMTGWEAFAASRLEFAPEAAVDVDQLYLMYARWCASHGQPLLEEEKALAWLRDHGATRRTGPLSQSTMLAGVRVVA